MYKRQAQGKKEEAEEMKKKVSESADRMEALSKEEKEVEEKIKKIMMTIPNIIDPVSYTHLDVYKRQEHRGSDAGRFLFD